MFFTCKCGTTVHLNTKTPENIREIDKVCHVCWKNSFSCWFFREYEFDWNVEYLENGSFSNEASAKYENWCEENNIKPIWNG